MNFKARNIITSCYLYSSIQASQPAYFGDVPISLDVYLVISSLDNFIQSNDNPLPDQTIQAERILNVINGQMGAKRNPFSCNHIAEFSSLHTAGFDIPLGYQPFKMPVYRPDRNPKLRRQRSLGCFGVFIKMIQDD